MCRWFIALCNCVCADDRGTLRTKGHDFCRGFPLPHTHPGTSGAAAHLCEGPSHCTHRECSSPGDQTYVAPGSQRGRSIDQTEAFSTLAVKLNILIKLVLSFIAPSRPHPSMPHNFSPPQCPTSSLHLSFHTYRFLTGTKELRIRYRIPKV